jgi:hypothetical protein
MVASCSCIPMMPHRLLMSAEYIMWPPWYPGHVSRHSGAFKLRLMAIEGRIHNVIGHVSRHSVPFKLRLQSNFERTPLFFFGFLLVCLFVFFPLSFYSFPLSFPSVISYFETSGTSLDNSVRRVSL